MGASPRPLRARVLVQGERPGGGAAHGERALALAEVEGAEGRHAPAVVARRPAGVRDHQIGGERRGLPVAFSRPVAASAMERPGVGPVQWCSRP
ncbi:hypothetical protein [Nonomuraea angiospora]